jgi:hypothetical protein
MLAGCSTLPPQQYPTQEAATPGATLAQITLEPATLPAAPAIAMQATATALPVTPATVPQTTAQPAPTAPATKTRLPVIINPPTPSPLPTETAIPTAATVIPVQSGATLTIPLPGGMTMLDATISPDGQSVVYVADPGVGYEDMLYSVPIQGGTPTVLGSFAWEAREDIYYIPPYPQYVITPDSQAVLFQRDDTLYRVPIAGGERQQLASGLGAAGAAGPLTSESNRSLHNLVPDFRMYASCSCIIYRTKTALTALTLDGAQLLTISSPAGTDRYIYGYSVSPDGRWLLYDLRRNDPWDEPKTPSWGASLIKVVEVSSIALPGGAPVVLATAPTEDGAILEYSVGPDVATLYYTTNDEDGEYTTQNVRSWQVALSGGTPVPR